jgi:cyclohexanone monooxygenase
MPSEPPSPRADLREKYKAEREKRIRAEGLAQYQEMSGELKRYADDPYAEGRIDRSPLREDVDAVIVGAGFSGMVSAVQLRKNGVESFRVIERGGDFGGTWYWNRYPGIACDVEAAMYLPMLEDVPTYPSLKYTRGSEIFRHCKAVAAHFDLYRHALFQTQVEEIRWDAETRRWHVRTDRGDVIRAKYVLVGSGPLNKPKLPGIPGVRSFKGKSFHTSRWDFDYTGGDETGNLTKLQDKRVAIIGTGATAIQCVPHLARWAKQLYVVQRTPAIVDIRGNGPVDAAWFDRQQPGWQRERRENFESILAGTPQEVDLVSDQWTTLWKPPSAVPGYTPETAEAISDAMEFEQLERIRNRVSSIVKDPATAEALKPYYNRFCKRPCFHDEYLEAFNRPSVTLLDTQGKGVDRITEDSIVVQGRAYNVDCIIFATGFFFRALPQVSAGFEIYGVDGLALTDRWRERVQTLHGMFTSGFPGLFIIGGGRQSGLSNNVLYVFEEQAEHAAVLIARFLRDNAGALDVKPTSEAAWHDVIVDKAPKNQAYMQACTPSSFNQEGKLDAFVMAASVYGGGPVEYGRVLRAWRQGDVYSDFRKAS